MTVFANFFSCFRSVLIYILLCRLRANSLTTSCATSFTTSSKPPAPRAVFFHPRMSLQPPLQTFASTCSTHPAQPPLQLLDELLCNLLYNPLRTVLCRTPPNLLDGLRTSSFATSFTNSSATVTVFVSGLHGLATVWSWSGWPWLWCGCATT